jgi:hypothetical protein
MTVLLTVRLNDESLMSSVHAGCSLIFDSRRVHHQLSKPACLQGMAGFFAAQSRDRLAICQRSMRLTGAAAMLAAGSLV